MTIVGHRCITRYSPLTWNFRSSGSSFHQTHRSTIPQANLISHGVFPLDPLRGKFFPFPKRFRSIRSLDFWQFQNWTPGPSKKTTTHHPPWPKITFLVSFSPTGHCLTFGQPALAIGQTTYQADTWPSMGKPLEPESQKGKWCNAPGRHLELRLKIMKNHTTIQIFTKQSYTTREKINKQIWVDYSLHKLFNVLQLKDFPLFFRSLRLPKEILLPQLLSRNLATPNIRARFYPQSPPKKTWINKKNTTQIKTFSHLWNLLPKIHQKNGSIQPEKPNRAWLAGWTFSTGHLQDDIEPRIGLQGGHLWGFDEQKPTSLIERIDAKIRFASLFYIITVKKL